MTQEQLHSVIGKLSLERDEMVRVYRNRVVVWQVLAVGFFLLWLVG